MIVDRLTVYFLSQLDHLGTVIYAGRSTTTAQRFLEQHPTAAADFKQIIVRGQFERSQNGSEIRAMIERVPIARTRLRAGRSSSSPVGQPVSETAWTRREN